MLIFDVKYLLITHWSDRNPLNAEEGLFALSPADGPVSVVSDVSVTTTHLLNITPVTMTKTMTCNYDMTLVDMTWA